MCFFRPALATEVKEVVSPGGFKAWLVEEHVLPLVAVKIAFTGSGSAYDPAGKEGRSNMTAALLMEGAGDMDSRAFNEALENNAIELNFGTDEDLFRASLESLSEHKEKAFSYLGMALTKPRFDDSALERVRSQTLSLLTQEEQEPGYLLHRGWQQAGLRQTSLQQSAGRHEREVGKLAAKAISAISLTAISRARIS